MINLNLALNNVSFGFCSYNLLLEIYNKQLTPNLFPIYNNADISAYDKTKDGFPQYISAIVNKAKESYKRSYPSFRLWHINGSEASESDRRFLFTFHELDALTPTEVNILNNQNAVFVSSNYTRDVFVNSGVEVPVIVIPLGFDSNHFVPTNKRYYVNDVTVWSVFGKLENRKRHAKTIQSWLKKYGNNPKHMLHLQVYNNMLSPEHNNTFLANIFEGKRYSNVNALGYTKTLSELNANYNATDIVLDMSGAEGWSLPSFHCVGLGKHAVIHNVTAMKDWANNDNAVLIEPDKKIEVYDGMFFHKGDKFNQGNIWDWNEDEFIAGCEKALTRFQNNRVNMNGLKIQQDFTWKKSWEKIQTFIESIK